MSDLLLTESEYIGLGFDVFDNPGRRPQPVNAYVCDLCKAILVTIELHFGQVPFYMPCKSGNHPELDIRYKTGKRPQLVQNYKFMPDGSPVSMRSTNYAFPFPADKATVEFYRPPYEVYASMSPGPLRDSVGAGRLLFRTIGEMKDINLENIEK